MVLEPLLLFDAVFTENRPVVDLVAPEFTYRSDFLQAWYESDLTPSPVDLEQIAADNLRKNQRREELQTAIASARHAHAARRCALRCACRHAVDAAYYQGNAGRTASCAR